MSTNVKKSYKYQKYYILKGEKGETGPVGPAGTSGEKGARGRRGKRVTYSKYLILIGLNDFLTGISGDLFHFTSGHSHKIPSEILLSTLLLV